jgi:hypothetical protein
MAVIDPFNKTEVQEVFYKLAKDSFFLLLLILFGHDSNHYGLDDLLQDNLH